MTPLTVEWLKAQRWYVLPRFERQPTDHYRRCIGREVIGDLFMSAAEDLCIDVSESPMPGGNWSCWITRASAQNNHASVWLHVRHLKYCEELILLYEALTGRAFIENPAWNAKGRELFPWVPL